jgi:hypothetical protein
VAAQLSMLSLALCCLAAVAFYRRRRGVLILAALLFFPVTAAATVSVWWAISHVLAMCIIAATLALPIVLIALFLVDLIWAPFCFEMTYATIPCWILCPLGVLLNYVGLAVNVRPN